MGLGVVRDRPGPVRDAGRVIGAVARGSLGETVQLDVGGRPLYLDYSPNITIGELAARTRTFSTLRPSASCSMPSTASRPPFGVSRTISVTPSGAIVQGRGAETAPPPAGRTK